LDWGLGHATRCIPIIQLLLDKGVDVVIGADHYPLVMLKEEFPSLEFITFPGYEIKYPKKKGMNFKMLFQTPKVFHRIKKENEQLQQIIDDYQIDGVISDNRFGLYSEKVPCVFVSHQIHIQAPLMKRSIYKTNKKFIERYHQCWIPDVEGDDSLSGALSHNYQMPRNSRYIGPISRLEKKKLSSSNKYEVAAILSGPEPQRQLFEEKIIDQLTKLNLKSIIVRGIPNEEKVQKLPNNICFENFLPSKSINEIISNSKLIVSRSGYSSIMDFCVLHKKAYLVPTPGQTEQEYLAKFHKSKGWFNADQQADMNILKALERIDDYKPAGINYGKEKLDQLITDFISKI